MFPSAKIDANYSPVTLPIRTHAPLQMIRASETRTPPLYSCLPPSVNQIKMQVTSAPSPHSQSNHISPPSTPDQITPPLHPFPIKSHLPSTHSHTSPPPTPNQITPPSTHSPSPPPTPDQITHTQNVIIIIIPIKLTASSYQ